jgi:hypothetical protein
MLVNVRSDARFQHYLDVTEQALYVEMAGVLTAAIRLQVNRNSVQAGDYLTKRGGPLPRPGRAPATSAYATATRRADGTLRSAVHRGRQCHDVSGRRQRPAGGGHRRPTLSREKAHARLNTQGYTSYADEVCSALA